MHELICTVPRFLKKWVTIGRFSEQSAESLHVAVNMEARSLAALRSKTDQLRLQFGQELRVNTDKSLGTRVSRMCPYKHSGMKRSFLRMGSDKEKHCPVCQPEFFE